MCPKDVDGMANSVDPHQTACLSESLGSLRYAVFFFIMPEKKAHMYTTSVHQTLFGRKRMQAHLQCTVTNIANFNFLRTRESL